MKHVTRVFALLTLGLAGFQANGSDSLQGKWTTGCIDDPYRIVFEFSDSTLWVSQFYYQDANCKGPLLRRLDAKYTYQTDEFGSIDYRVESILQTYYSMRDIDNKNATQECGVTWIRGQAQEMTQTSCGLKQGTNRYGVYQITDDQLKIGSIWSASEGYLGESESKDRPEKASESSTKLRRDN